MNVAWWIDVLLRSDVGHLSEARRICPTADECLRRGGRADRPVANTEEDNRRHRTTPRRVHANACRDSHEGKVTMTAGDLSEGRPIPGVVPPVVPLEENRRQNVSGLESGRKQPCEEIGGWYSTTSIHI
jgi:hypothetical protein